MIKPFIFLEKKHIDKVKYDSEIGRKISSGTRNKRGRFYEQPHIMLLLTKA